MIGRGVVEDELDPPVGRTYVIERAVDDDATAIHDRDVIRDLLDVGELVRREQNRAAVVAGLLHENPENLFRRGGIEARHRFVQDQELGTGRQRKQQRELRAHAARQLLDGRIGPQLELREIRAREVGPPARIERRREPDQLGHGHPRVEILFLTDEGGATSDLDACSAVVGGKAKDACVAGRRPNHAEQHLDRGRLAGAIASQEPADRAARHAQRKACQRLDVAVRLTDVGRLDDHPLSHLDLPLS